MNFMVFHPYEPIIGPLLGIAVLYAGYRFGVYRGRFNVSFNLTPETEREILLKEREIHSLKETITRLKTSNTRYVTLMQTLTLVIRRLNTSLNIGQICTEVLGLTRQIMMTDRVRFYVYNESDRSIRQISKDPTGNNEEKIFQLGEGLVGRAVKAQRICSLDAENPAPGPAEADGHEQIWMVAPMSHNGRVLGALAIGRPDRVTGHEEQLLDMIAQVAGAALNNQSFLQTAEQQATTDPLTNLHNRRYFMEKSQAAVLESIRSNTPVSLFLFDIDHFKHYNDTNGHQEGDRLLQNLSQLVQKHTRKTSTLARYGGEEFIVLLPGQNQAEAHVYAERVRAAIAAHPFSHAERQPLGHVSISGGVATFPTDGASFQEVLRLADAALYEGKNSGRNRVETHKAFFFESDESAEANSAAEGAN